MEDTHIVQSSARGCRNLFTDGAIRREEERVAGNVDSSVPDVYNRRRKS
jgi:hypothetical protein